jgi:acid phosphatase type 7
MTLLRSTCRRAPLALLLAMLTGAGAHADEGNATNFTVDVPRGPLTFVAYGDIRFTATSETEASQPRARESLIAKIASEAPAAIFLSGDVPWHGGTVDDYAVMARETAIWRERAIPLFPALGNHEFSQCAEAECLEHWWTAYPALRGHRWYTVALGARLRAFALDSDAPLVTGSEQQRWLSAGLAALPASVDFVFIFLHHPPAADLQTGVGASHNPRPNELALAALLKDAAHSAHARFIVCAGHIHNYERRTQDGILYLVSGGGGAHPVPVVREPADDYQDPAFPVFHYLRFTLEAERLRGEMFRLEDYDAPAPRSYALKDSFSVNVAGR